MNPLIRTTFLLAFCLVSSSFAREKPNVLFIAVDDLNDWVGCLGGHPQADTPHIDALAEDGTLFVHAYCAAPVCGPSRTALMYGIAPHKSGSYGHHTVYFPTNLVPEERLPLNLVFQRNGYRTAGCGKIFHYRETRGWDAWRANFNGIPPEHRTPDRSSTGALQAGIQQTDDDRDTSDGKLTDWAIEQLQRGHDRPFFIALGLRKPHLPWDAPRKYFARHERKQVMLPDVPDDDLDDLPAIGRVFARQLVGFREINDHQAVTATDGAWRDLVRGYLATSSFADANVGRIIEVLDTSDHADNTIVVLWGDHGWHLGEKQGWRKMTLWERGTRTPLIIRMPDGHPSRGTRVEAPVSLQDIFPTLIDLCGLEVDQTIDGHSLKPLLENSTTVREAPALMSHGPGNFALRKDRWRLIRYSDGSEELYDLEIDPHEITNLANDPRHDATRATLRQHLPQTWQYVMGPRFKKFSHCFARPPSR